MIGVQSLQFRIEIGGDKMKSLGINIPRCFRFESLRCRMINLPKASGTKFPVKRQGQWIEARAQNDDLGNSVLKRFAGEKGEALSRTSVSTGSALHWRRRSCS